MSGSSSGPKAPKPPRLPRELTPAGRDDAELVHDGKHLSLDYAGLDLFVPEDDPEDVTFERCRFTDTRLAGLTLHRAGFADVVFQGCDLANLRLFDSRVFNASVTTCRMTGTQFTEAGLRDVTFEGCRADLAGFRFAVLRNVVFRDCNLTEANFQNAELRDVRFEDCALVAAQFSQASLRDVRFDGCDLSGLGGVEGLDGATVGPSDARSLLPSLAAAAGIAIDD
ncbi:pentapeptide repeat-containing protein [Actinomadura logoneensis]|uniref:Pentapeptide repeat-containing protein n=1 Tax=Actinomadura logoneensis TaxID=2293572 RepID=A0A372JT01_9ACTN|nr:pentapeptide repeat-containing protein [Actinomadura logoneensis]RFU43151.1 pentapeptide repeat-containing protein [Actinomadura logoneensis]